MSRDAFYNARRQPQQGEEDGEEDYMSMQFIESPKRKIGKETLSQKLLRKQREVREPGYWLLFNLPYTK